MAGNIALNDAGEAMVFDGQAWAKAPIAVNDKGEKAVFDGKGWQTIAGDGTPTAKVSDPVNTGVNWLGTQLTKGATALAGLPSDLQSLGNAGAKAALEATLGPGKATQPLTQAMPGNQDLNKTIFGSLGVPEVNAADNPAFTAHNDLLGRDVNFGKILDAGAQMIPSGLAIPTKAISALGRAASRTVPSMLSGVGSEAAGQAAEGSPYEIPARLLGGVVGGFAGAKAVTPLAADLAPEEARMVQLAKDNNVPLTVGQETGRGRGIESALSRFPTSAGPIARAGQEQDTAINRMASKLAGTEVDRVDPASMNTVQRNASDAFETAKQFPERVELKPDFYNQANSKVASYLENTPESNQVPAVTKRLNDFFDTKLMGKGPYPELSSQQYQEFRRSVNDAIEGTTDGSAKQALKGIREALDSAAEASLPADKAEFFKEARKNWANFKVLSKATSGGSIDSRSTGDLTPASLTSALRQAQGPDKFARTEGGMNDVARLAGYLADTRPNSDTPATLQMQHILTGGGPGALPGYIAGGPAGAVAGSALSLAAPNMLARVMAGGRGGATLRDYLANQSLSPSMLLPYSSGGGALATLPSTRRSK